VKLLSYLPSFFPISCLLGSLTLGLASCGPKQAAQPPKPARPVTAAIASSRDVPIYLDEIGNCTAYETVTIQPQVSGPIVGIHFTDGQELQKGDLLFTIDSRPFQAALDRAKATLEQDKAKFDFAQSQLRRNEELKRTKVISPSDYDNAISNDQAAKAAVHADEAAVEQAQINLDYCTIRSPIVGRASKRMVDLGNVVGTATPLLMIQRQDPVYVDFTVPESSLPKVRKYREANTLAVEASFADDPSKRRLGQFDFIDSGVQQSTGTVRMRAVMENKDRLFWPGQFVNVRILLDTMKNTVLVPGEAVQVGSAGTFVFVIKPDQTVELRPVKTGQRQGDDMAILDGVKAGEQVVVTGQLALAPGTQVQVDSGASVSNAPQSAPQAAAKGQ
jgi:multidrug efflux system membrane fusion protein